MDEQVIFTSAISATVTQIHSAGQANLKQCAVSSRNSAVVIGNRLLIAQENKALINCYITGGSKKRESIDQRLPLPEVFNCLEVVQNPVAGRSCNGGCKVDVGYLLLGSTGCGKLYIWEMGSGKLLGMKPMAHYQAITKIQSIVNSKYVMTSGADGRLNVWQTLDLVTEQEPKPVYTLHDHTLPITDFVVSNAYNGEYLNTKVFTVSEDMTLRCYQISSQFEKPLVLNVFTFSSPLISVALDPGDRCLYVGTSDGTLVLPIFYSLDETSGKLVNLLQLGENKILSVSEISQEATPNRQQLFNMGKLVCEKIYSGEATALQVSVDGSLLVLGTMQGTCMVVDVYSKQTIKELAPLVTKDAILGPVNNLLLIPSIMRSESLDVLSNSKNSPDIFKIPNLEKAIYSGEGVHNIMHQTDITTDIISVSPLAHFENYLDNVAHDENTFIHLGLTNSTRNEMERPEAISRIPTISDDDKTSEISKMKETIKQLTGAYKDLREIHENLYKEHQRILQNNK